jgi:hypothetical protein
MGIHNLIAAKKIAARFSKVLFYPLNSLKFNKSEIALLEIE